MNSNPQGAKERVLQVWPDAICIQTVADSQHKSYCWIHRGDNNIAAHEERIGQGCDEASAWSDAATRLPTSGAPVAPSVEPQNYLPPAQDKSLHFEDEQVMTALVGTDYLRNNVRQRLNHMTSGEKWSLYRAIVSLVAPPVAPEGQDGLDVITDGRIHRVMDGSVEVARTYDGPTGSALDVAKGIAKEIRKDIEDPWLQPYAVRPDDWRDKEEHEKD